MTTEPIIAFPSALQNKHEHEEARNISAHYLNQILQFFVNLNTN